MPNFPLLPLETLGKALEYVLLVSAALGGAFWSHRAAKRTALTGATVAAGTEKLITRVEAGNEQLVARVEEIAATLVRNEESAIEERRNAGRLHEAIEDLRQSLAEIHIFIREARETLDERGEMFEKLTVRVEIAEKKLARLEARTEDLERKAGFIQRSSTAHPVDS